MPSVTTPPQERLTKGGRHSRHGARPNFRKIEITLTGPERDYLAEGMREHVLSGTVEKDHHAIGKIMEERLPPKVVKLVKRFEETPGLPVLLIIRNLYEEPIEDLAALSKPKYLSHPDYIVRHTYGAHYAQGVTALLGFPFAENGFDALIRRPSDTEFQGSKFHRDGLGSSLSVIAGIRSDGAVTQYADWQGIARMAVEQGLGDLVVTVRPNGDGNDIQLEKVTLEEFSRDIGKYKSIREVHYTDPKQEQLLNQMIHDFTHEVTLGAGDLAIASNLTPVLHRARGTDNPQVYADGYTRLAALYRTPDGPAR